MDRVEIPEDQQSGMCHEFNNIPVSILFLKYKPIG